MTFSWPDPYPGAHWIDAREEEAVLDVLRRRALFRYYGVEQPRYVESLEKAAMNFYGVRHALAVGSGTGALSTAMMALGIGPGSEVIMPAFYWVAISNAAVLCNAIPLFAEVDESYTLDPEDVARLDGRNGRDVRVPPVVADDLLLGELLGVVEGEECLWHLDSLPC